MVEIITYGCALNKADSEKIKYLIKNMEIPEDIVIINTCGVKLQTENRIVDHIKKLKSLGKKVIVCGCLPSINFKRILDLKPYAILDVYSLDKIREAILKGGIYLSSEQNKKILDLPQTDDSEKFTSIIPISYGCLGNCTYCGTKFARRKLVSRKIESIIEQIKTTEKKEIFLTSEDCGCYGFDIGTDLIELMENITKLKKEIFVRIGMANPQWLLKYLEDFIELLKDEKFYKFVHIPVQSGSNKILNLMNRYYTKEDFIYLVDKLKKEIPNITIATDIIIGFPGETEEDFEETVDLIKKTRPVIVNISKFFPRPNTEAAKMKKVPSQIVKERSIKLSRICREINKEEYLKDIGKEYKVLYLDNFGKTINYKKVIIPKFYKENLFLKNVKIVEYNNKSLIGRILQE